mgnify:CR=1 FL=1
MNRDCQLIWETYICEDDAPPMKDPGQDQPPAIVQQIQIPKIPRPPVDINHLHHFLRDFGIHHPDALKKDPDT